MDIEDACSGPLERSPTHSAFTRLWPSTHSLPAGLLLLANLAPDLAKVMSWVDFGTLGLLFGMMLIVGQVGKN